VLDDRTEIEQKYEFKKKEIVRREIKIKKDADLVEYVAWNLDIRNEGNIRVEDGRLSLFYFYFYLFSHFGI